MSPVQNAFHELRNALWMLGIPLVLACYSLFVVCQWNIQDLQLEDRQRDVNQAAIEEVSDGDCALSNRPEGAICARSTDWWTPADPDLCGGTTPCYQLAEWTEVKDNYLPLLVPGLGPLILIPLGMRKISRARSALRPVVHPAE